MAGFLEELDLTCPSEIGGCGEQGGGHSRQRAGGNQGWEMRWVWRSLDKSLWGGREGLQRCCWTVGVVQGQTPVGSGFKSGPCSGSSVTLGFFVCKIGLIRCPCKSVRQ